MGGGTNHRIDPYDAILVKSQLSPRAMTAYEAVGQPHSQSEAGSLSVCRAYAETGADFLRFGALAPSARNADLSLLVASLE
jgi:nicotinate-nucleotide pyrophosphorylase